MKLLVVTKFLAKGKAREELWGYLSEAGFSGAEVTFASVLPQNYPFNESPSRVEIIESRSSLETHTATHVLAFGNEALLATTGHSGITKWRGRMLDSKIGPPVMATLSPAAVSRNPSQRMGLVADMRFLYNHTHGVQLEGGVPSGITIVDTRAKVRELLDAIAEADAVAFDVETDQFDEQAPGASVITLALTLVRSHASDTDRSLQGLVDAPMTCWAIPLHHRASRWQLSWQQLFRLITQAMAEVPWRIAHNAKFDCRWVAEFGTPVPVNFDTMLAAHLLNENRPKGLKPLARIELGAEEWDISIKHKKGVPWYETLPLRDILTYNAMDTWHTARLFKLFGPQLIQQPRLLALFKNLIMPASQSLVHIERRGVYIDRKALAENARTVDERLAAIHRDLAEFLPEPDDMPSLAINFGPSNFLRWFLYEYLGLPVLKEGKTGPSVAETVLTHLKDEHPAIPLLLDRVVWAKFRSGFFTPYSELITEDSRLHTTFKLAGTVTGRLSSGKADPDKVTGSRASTLRGVNLQQVPRNTLVRGLFGAPPGWSFVEADYSQIELRIAAWIANEPTMLMLYATGQDIHMATAMRMTGKPASAVTPEERKKAKAVNFGFLYGMGWRKFIDTAWNNYGLQVLETEAQGFRRAFFEQFPMLPRWHARQRRLAHRYKRVESPLGRVRHLPDIDSPDDAVVGEAERQAINSPVQAMASDLCLLSLVILDRKFRRMRLRARPIGTVHDAINFEVPNDELDQVIPLIRHVMENPPLEQLFGVSLTVPIIADISIGTRWGMGEEVD